MHIISISPFQRGQLPHELWDRIIDFVAGGYNNILETSWRHNVLACCLVCRAFTPRCRYHLYEHIVLRSGQNLSHVARALSDFPSLCRRVNFLTIDATGSVDQSWVSSVPFRLPLSSFPLHPGILSLQGVDLSTLHPRAHQAFARVVFTNVVLRDVRFSSYHQLVRYFGITYNIIILQRRDDVHVEKLTGRIPPGRSVSPLRKHYTGSLPRRFTLDMSWAALASLTCDLDPTRFEGSWHMFFQGEYPFTQEATAPALANILQMFKRDRRQAYKQSEAIRTFGLESGPLRFELRQHRPYGTTGTETYLCFTVNFHRVDAEYSAAIGHFVYCLSSSVYSSLKIRVSSEGGPAVPTQELIMHWKHIDAALTSKTYSNMKHFQILGTPRMSDLPQDNEYGCIAELFQDLLPMFTAKVTPQSLCTHNIAACPYHTERAVAQKKCAYLRDRMSANKLTQQVCKKI